MPEKLLTPDRSLKELEKDKRNLLTNNELWYNIYGDKIYETSNIFI